MNCVNPTVVKNDMGKSTWDDPVKAPAALARIPQGKFAGMCCVNAMTFYHGLT